jgi:hypothetical protein
MELLLSGVSKNKEVYKEVILRSFYCFESLPIVETNVEFSYGCRLFSVSSGMGARPALNLKILMRKDQDQSNSSKPRNQMRMR